MGIQGSDAAGGLTFLPTTILSLESDNWTSMDRGLLILGGVQAIELLELTEYAHWFRRSSKGRIASHGNRVVKWGNRS